MLKGVGLDYLWRRDARPRGDGARAAGGQHRARSTSGWSSDAPHPVPGAGRSAARRARPGDAGAGAGRCRSSSCWSCRTPPPSRSATRRSTSSISIARALSRGLVNRLAASGHFRDRRHVGVARTLANEALLRGDVTMVRDDPARLRGVARADRRRAGAARRSTRRRDRPPASSRPTRRASSRVLRAELDARLRPSTPRSPTAPPPPRGVADRCARAQLVQPDAQLQALHGAGHPGRAGHDDRHAADGAEHRAREGAGHARAAQRDADHARPVHRREAAAVLGARPARSGARPDRRQAGVRRADARAACCCCSASAARLPGGGARRSACGSRRWSRRSSRRCSSPSSS